MSHNDHKVIYKQRDERARMNGRKERKVCAVATSGTEKERVHFDCIENCIFIFIFMDTQLICFEFFLSLSMVCVVVLFCTLILVLARSFSLVTLVFFVALRFVSVFINAFIIIAHINCRSKWDMVVT